MFLKRRLNTYNNFMTQITKFLHKNYLNLILMLSTIGTVGSLIFSDFMGLEPCKACWYQRVALYPMVLISAVAMYRKDQQAKWYLFGLSIFGLFVSTLQVADEVFGTKLLGLINCSASACVEGTPSILGPISIPMMAWGAFLLITVILAIVLKTQSSKK